MSTLTPTGGRGRRRRGAALVLAVGLLALAIGGGLGWWLTNRDSTGDATSPTPQVTCSSPAPSASGTKLPKPKRITVDVLNSTDRQGLAGTTAEQLEERGFEIGDIANDPLGKELTVTAEVRFGPKGKQQALVVAAQVPDSELVNDKRGDRTVALSLGTAFDGLATPEEAAAALAPSPTPGC